MEEELKWKVQYIPIAEPMPYRVYRRKTLKEPLHSGNVEYSKGFWTNKLEAQKFANKLNLMEEQK